MPLETEEKPDIGPDSGRENRADEELLRSYAESADKDAMGAIFSKYAGTAYRIALRYCGNGADAEEVVQTAFFNILRNHRQYRFGRNVKVWIMTIVRNACLSKMRTDSARLKREESVAEEYDARDSRPVEDREMAKALKAAVQALPEHYRMPVWMHYLEGFSFREIAETLSIGESTVRTQASRGVEKLREAMAAAGYAVTMGVLPALVAAIRVESVPAGLTSSLTGMLSGAAASAGGVSSVAGAAKMTGFMPASLKLSGGVIMKIAAGIVVVGAIAGGVMLASSGSSQPSPSGKPAGAAVAKADSPGSGRLLEGKYRIPDPDPEFVKWEKVWIENRRLEARVGELRHEIAFLRIMDALKLSSEQMKQLLPIAVKARKDARDGTADFIKWFEEGVITRLATYSFDAMTEDLIDKGERTPKMIHGNFDPEKVLGAEPARHPHGMDGKFIQALRADGREMEKLLTPEQLKILSTDQASAHPLAPVVRSIRGNDFPGAYNFVPVQYLGTLNTGNSFAMVPAHSPCMGLLLALNAVPWLESRLGQAQTIDAAAKEKDIKDIEKAYRLAREERQYHGKKIVQYNWVKGMKLSRKQTEAFCRLSREMLKLYIREEEAYEKSAREYVDALGKVRDHLARSEAVPEDLLAKEKKAGVAGSYWGGAAQGCAWAEDNTFQARATGVWKMFPSEVQKFMAEADAALLEPQKVVLWDVHGDCFRPWFAFTNPVNAGAPAKTQEENPDIARLRKLADAEAAALMEKLAQQRDQAVAKRKAERKNAPEWAGWGGAEFVSMTFPATMTAEKNYAVTVVMKNTGKSAWTAAGVFKLGAQPDGNTWGLRRAELEAPAQPGQNAAFKFTVEAPPNPVDHLFQWRMTEEGKRWFGEITPTITIPVCDAAGRNQGKEESITITVENCAKAEHQWAIDFLKRVRAMTDSEYRVNMYYVAFLLTGNWSEFTNDPGGMGIAEQNGVWPKLDWSKPEVIKRWEARLEEMLMPEHVPFYQARIAIMSQFEARPKADLEKLAESALPPDQSSTAPKTK